MKRIILFPLVFMICNLYGYDKAKFDIKKNDLFSEKMLPEHMSSEYKEKKIAQLQFFLKTGAVSKNELATVLTQQIEVKANQFYNFYKTAHTLKFKCLYYMTIYWDPIAKESYEDYVSYLLTYQAHMFKLYTELLNDERLGLKERK